MIYVTTGGFSDINAAEVAHNYLQSGINNIELSAGRYCPDIEKKLSALSNKCTFALHNYFPVPQESFVLNLASLDETIFTKSYDHIRNAISLANRLGSKYYSFHAGFLLDPKPSELGKKINKQAFFDREICVERFVTATNALAKHANELNITLLIENNVCSPRNYQNFGKDPFLLSDPKGIDEIFQHLSSDVKMLIDVAHLKVSANTLQYDIEMFFSESDNIVGGYHLSDNCGTVDSNQEFGDDAYFWKHLKKDLDYYTIEVYNVDNDKLLELLDLTNKKLS